MPMILYDVYITDTSSTEFQNLEYYQTVNNIIIVIYPLGKYNSLKKKLSENNMKNWYTKYSYLFFY